MKGSLAEEENAKKTIQLMAEGDQEKTDQLMTSAHGVAHVFEPLVVANRCTDPCDRDKDRWRQANICEHTADLFCRFRCTF